MTEAADVAADVDAASACFAQPPSPAVVAAQDVLRRLTRDVSNFPVPGVLFKDIVPVLGNAHGLGVVVAAIAELAHSSGVTKVAGIEARGFLLAAPVAVAAGVGLVPVRKAELMDRLLQRGLEVHSLCTYMVRGEYQPGPGYYVPTLFPESG